MDYTELQQELQTWLGDVNFDLGLMLPGIIRDAEAQMNRRVRTIETECRTTADLTPNGVTEDQLGIYAVPIDWNGHKTVERRGDLLVILYFQKIPALTDLTPTNWMLDSHPDLYRYTALSYCNSFLEKPIDYSQRIELIYDEMIASDQAKRFGGGPLHTRIPTQRRWRSWNATAEPDTDGRLEYLPPYDFFDLEDSGMTFLPERIPGYFTVSENLIRIYPKPALPTP